MKGVTHRFQLDSGYPPTEAGPLLGAYVFILISNDTGYVRIEGIEIDGSNVNNAETLRGITLDDEDDTMEDNRISHCLIHDLMNSTVDDSDGSWVRGIRLDLTNNTKVSNNIVYNLTNVSTNVDASIRGILANNAGKTRYIYNNTVYNIRTIASTGTARGIYDKGGSTVIARNNYVGLVDSVLGPEQGFQGSFAAESNNVSSDATAAGPGSQINQAAYASYFVSTTPGSEDLHLLNDSFTLWGSNGADLDSDPNLPVTDDIDGATRDAATPDIGADEFGAVSCSPTINLRSIGMQTTPLANTGTATVGLGATTVAFSGVSLPANVGRGDELVFAGETLYVLWQVSPTELILQTPATMDHTSESYTIQRAFRGATAIQDWESARDGDLIAQNRREVGVAYNDGAFTASASINSSITDVCRYMHLTVASGQRHDGTAGTGVVLDGQDTDQGFRVQDDYTVIEWFEVARVRGGVSASAVVVQNASNVLLQGLLVHDYLDAANVVTGVRGESNAGYTVRNSIFYDGDRAGIRNNDASATGIVENCTIYAMKATDGSMGIGVFSDAGGTLTVTNTVSMGNTGADFSGPMTQSYNLSEFATASGTGSLTGKDPTLQFVNITPGDEVNWDLHLKVGADAIDAGTDLSANFFSDIDGQLRVTPWDIGADDFDATTAVELVGFEAAARDGAVELSWETASELNNLGFHLYRSLLEEGPYEQITESVIPGLGSSPAGATYSYRDSGLTNGLTYFYQLEDIETTGNTEMHGPVSATPEAGASSSSGDSGPSDSSSGALITYGDPSASSLKVVRRGRGQVVLKLTTGGFYAEPQEDGTVRLTIPDFAQLEEEAGSPSMPVKRTWVEAVAGRKVKLVSVQARGWEAFTSLRPTDAALAEIVASRDGTVRASRRRLRAAFRNGELYPAEAARLVSVGFQGEVKKALVELAPLRWDEATGQLLLAKRLVVRLSFRGREPGEHSTDGVRGRRYRRRQSHDERRVVARLGTTERGLYGVRFEDVFHGRRRGVRVSALRLSRQGETVAFHLEPDPNRFKPGSMLYFVSEGASANPYGNEAVYELEVGRQGAVMLLSSAAPSGEATSFYWKRIEQEQNRYYQAALLNAPDLWLWDLLFAPATKSYPFDVSALAPSSQASTLSVWLQGVSDFEADPDHHVRVYVNGNFLDEVSWDGDTPRRIDVELLPGILKEGENLLELENVGDTEAAYSMVMLDRFAVRYPRLPVSEGGKLEGVWNESGVAEVTGLGAGAHVLDLTGEHPRWLSGAQLTDTGSVRFRAETGGSYLALSAEAVRRPKVLKVSASSLKSRQNRADYLLVGPRAFLGAAEPLLELRRSQGLTVKSVSIEEVYSEFGYGESAPRSLREFLSYAYHNWREPSLRYVVLLGDATFDFKDYFQTGVTNQVPPLMVKTRYLWTASDPSYAAINGDDVLPDLAIGRLPAATVDEARVMVEKIVAYETGEASLAAPAVLIADNPDKAGNFEADADELAATVLASKHPEKIYLSQLGKAATRNAIVDAFDQGASLMSYIGHGGIVIWASENVFNIWDVDSLELQAQQPLLLTMNCLNGYFHFPYFNALSEELVKAEGKGAIAAFSPSGLSLNGQAHRYHQALLQELFNGSHERLGDAVLAAQVAYAETGAFPELLSIYHLLGDPALVLR